MKVNAALRVEGAKEAYRPRNESIWDLLERELPDLPCWIAPAVLPKSSKMLLGGEMKIGKSFMCLEVARALSTGKSIFHSDTFTVEQCRCLYIDQEVGMYGLRERAKFMLANEDSGTRHNFHYVSKSPGLHLDQPEGLEMLKRECGDYRPGVLILDPASRLLQGEENDQRAVRNFFENIDHLIAIHKEDGLSVIVAHHYRKPPQDDLDLDDDSRYDPYNFRGSSEWVGAPDTILCAVRPARVPGEKEWLMGAQYLSRHGLSGDRLYLRVCPESPKTVYEIPSYEAHAILDGMRETRAALAEERKAKSGKSRKSNDAPWGGRHF